MLIVGNPCPQYFLPPITEAFLTTLLEAMSSGEKEIQYGDKKIVYHNIADMQKLYMWAWGIYRGGEGQRRIAMTYDSGLHGRANGLYETEEENFRTR